MVAMPRDVPIAQAATVMLVDDRPDLHVLMVRRTPAAVFGGGLWVFPGGRVDPADRSAPDAIQGLDQRDKADLDVDHPSSFWVAAVRETLEETGILLATDRSGAWASRDDAAPLREALLEGHPLGALLAAGGWRLPADRLHYVAQWITPPGPPRRFDARFFLTAAPPHTEADHDDDELVDAAWVRPQEVVDDPAFGLMSPTERMLRSLARFGSAAEALAVAAGRPPWQRARVVVDHAGRYEVLLPGEAGYRAGTEDVERGWVRLVK